MPNLFHENEFVFNVLFEAVSECVIVVDQSQTIVANNTAAEKMFGYEKGELQNQHLNILIPKNYHPGHGSHFNSFYKKSSARQMGNNRDLNGAHKNGHQFPVEVGLNPFEFDGEKYVMAIVIDITYRKNSENKIRELNTLLEGKISERTSELNNTVANLKNEIEKRVKAESKLRKALKKEKELNELKTKFLSLVSHEFKTPLSGMLNAAVLVGKYKKTEMQDKREKHLLTIKNKVHYLDGILNDFLSVERLESGRVSYKFSNFKLSKVVNEVIYNANLMLKSGQHIIYPKDIDNIDLYQDEKILELMLSNVLSNAIKYSPENTKIDFKINIKGAIIIFKIKDQGIGIPLKDQKHIFNRYFRAENALTNQGTGIGLNIVKSHLESLGGTIKFESIENEGTTFIVELPIINKK
ncbi:PAS domain-containing sensor histidine kinase [Lutibacter sp. A80]|uniref:PAS domain-containing sensor histidine kinase n=1 Tax=Lutibacter sp. A80 TaxID=2918453 RepID=UPI001F05AE3E|nr:PAS domain-containing sensor histidine kinase [Lutibacter sp. A80]UMB59845.1 PAS domain-containing sensor histidine kinase [Lutibacter sp. A80]